MLLQYSLNFLNIELIQEKSAVIAESPYETNSPSGMFLYSCCTSIINYFCNIGILFDGIKAALDDQGFRLPSKEAHTALDSAVNLHRWSTVPSSAFQLTASTLAKQVDALVKLSPTTKARREKVWVEFGSYVNSEAYHKIWKDLSESARVQLPPILIFFVTHYYFLNQLKIKSPLAESVPLENPAKISMDEENALYYVSGYVIRSLRKKLTRDPSKLNDDMISVLHSFLEDSEGHEDNDDENPDWISTIDRGGLLHCCMEFNHFLYAVEVVIKKEMRQGNEMAMKAGFKEKLTHIVECDEEVLFWWLTLHNVADIEDKATKATFSLILSHYITLRGFAFAARWMEAFKIRGKKNIQRSRSLRTKVQLPKACN